MDNIQKKVISGLGAELLASGDRVLVALSGGPDSVFLLHTLIELEKARALGFEITAAHLNHCLRREESDRDEAFTKDLCAQLGVPVVTERVNVKEMSGPSIEEKARNARYAFLRQTAQARNCNKVAAGHTQDDLAETVFFRIIRGTGVNGLAAIVPSRPLAPDVNILLIRPLLEIPKKEIMQSLEHSNTAYVTDSSNTDSGFTRNRIRNQLLPQLEQEFNPNVTSALAGLAHSARECNADVSAALIRIASGVLVESGIPGEVMRDLPPGEFQKLLNTVVADLSGSDITLSREKVKEAQRLTLGADAPNCVQLGRSILLRRSGRKLFAQKSFVSESVEALKPVEISLPGYAYIPGFGEVWAEKRKRDAFDLSMFRKFKEEREAVFDADGVGDRIVFRTAHPDEMMHPLGLNGKRKRVSKILRESGMPIMAEKGVVCVAAGDTIIWIPGSTTGHEFRVRDDTRSVYVIRIRPDECSG